MNSCLDESVGTMLPQVGLNGQILKREDYVTEWDNSMNSADTDNVDIDYVSKDTYFLLTSINKMKYKLFATRLLPFTEDNYVKEFDIIRNLISLEKKLRDVISRSSDNTKAAIESIIGKDVKERNDAINRLITAINVQDIKATGVATLTLIKANLLHNNDAEFIEDETENYIRIYNADYDLDFLSKEDLISRYPLCRKSIDKYVEVFNHIVNMASNINDNKEYIYSFEKENDDTILLVGCALLEVIEVSSIKELLPLYKDTVIGKYNRILSINEENNPYKNNITVECSRCPKTGNFYIHLIMKVDITTIEEVNDDEYIEGRVADIVDDIKDYFVGEKPKTNDLENPKKLTIWNGGYSKVVDNDIVEKNDLIYKSRENIIRIKKLKERIKLAEKEYKKTGDNKLKNMITGYKNEISKREKDIEKYKERLLKVYKYKFTESVDDTENISSDEKSDNNSKFIVASEALEDNLSIDECYDLMASAVTDEYLK